MTLLKVVTKRFDVVLEFFSVSSVVEHRVKPTFEYENQLGIVQIGLTTLTPLRYFVKRRIGIELISNEPLFYRMFKTLDICGHVGSDA